MLHFSHCEKENLVILMMRVRQSNPAYNTAADIVRIRKSTKSHVSTSLKVLEDRGCIERRVDKDNKKHVTIHLLQLANEVIEDGIWAQKEFAQDMFEGLSEEEIKVFMNVFQKVYDNAERMISNEKNA
ncbi:MarR family transcriptional regulator [Eubacterium sp. TM05-53]|nr:MarR family transcriptional regulator [Eubacterium sp. TM05-53]